MLRYKYFIEDADWADRETWVCENCRKENNEFILLGYWKLIDKRYDAVMPCDRCGKGVRAVNE